MKMFRILDLTLILATLAYSILIFVYPEFPLSEETFILLVYFILARLGIISFRGRYTKHGF